MTLNRMQQWAWAVVTALSMGCGAGEDFTSSAPQSSDPHATSTQALEVDAVRPDQVVARSSVHGVPDDVDLVNDVKDTASPDFDATYVEGVSGAGGSSSIDLTYPAQTLGGAPAVYVNVKYFMRNSACTAPLMCGRANSQLLSGTTVIATSAAHDLPAMDQGWYLFNDVYTLTASQAVSLSNLRTRIVFTWPNHSTTGIRLSSVAADFRSN